VFHGVRIFRLLKIELDIEQTLVRLKGGGKGVVQGKNLAHNIYREGGSFFFLIFCLIQKFAAPLVSQNVVNFGNIISSRENVKNR